MNILFVCSANISRSFLAERLLIHEIEKLQIHDIGVSSAGVYAYPGAGPDPNMLDYLEKQGIPVKEHEARKLTEREVNWADLILVMEKEQAILVESTWPGAKKKVEPLGKYITETMNVDDIMDPYGRSSYHYRLAQSQITLAVKSLTKKLLSD